MVRRQKAHDPTKVSKPAATEVVVRNVAHPRVWQTAIALAGGDKTRVRVETWGRVEVMVKETTATEPED